MMIAGTSVTVTGKHIQIVASLAHVRWHNKSQTYFQESSEQMSQKDTKNWVGAVQIPARFARNVKNQEEVDVERKRRYD